MLPSSSVEKNSADRSPSSALSYDEQDPWKGWTVQDVQQMREQQLREFCREVMIMASSEIPSQDLRRAVWKKLLYSKVAPSSLKEQDFENVSWSVSREELKQHLSSIALLSDEVVEKTYKILSFHHQFMKEKYDKANTPSSTIAPNIIEHILSYRPDMGRFVYNFINCIDDGSEKMNLSELYPMVYIMLNQYFKPLDSRKNITSAGSDAKIGYLLDCFDQMFRLLVQYHDPDLQLHFDRHRLEVIIDEIIPWSKSLLFDFIASSITDASELKQTLTYLLDILIIERDPVMYTFLVISILVRDRTNIMALDIPEELRSYCQAGLSSSKEKQQIIKSKMDIFSLYLEAKNLEKETPISARNQLQSIYQASFEAKFDTMKQLLQESVILPLPATEIADCFTKDKTRQQQRSQNSKVKYLVIDCRSVKSFQYARLPTAIHVGTRVGYDNDKMKAILSKFEDAKGSHFVIFGTGRKLPEEENLLRVIAMKFVTGGFPHISIAVDGFKGCIKYMTSNLIEYVKDETLENSKTSSSAEEWTSKVSETIFSWGKKAIGDIEEYVKEKKLVEQALTKLNSNKESALSTLNSLKNIEKTLEKTLEKKIKPVFSLGDNDSDDEISTSPTSVESTEATTIKLDDLSKLGDNIKLFTLQLKKNKETRYLVIGDNLIMCLKPHPQLFQSGIIQWKRTLRQVCKLTFKKTDATSLAFTLKGFPNTLSYTPQPQSTTDNSPPPSFSEQFTTDKATEIINLVQGNIKKLKENK